MDARVLADLGNDCGNATRNDLLRVRLARVDDVVDSDAAAELRSLGAGFCLRYPEQVTVRVVAKDVVVKIETEFAELPQLIRDVFAGVGDGTIGPHDDLV